MEKTTIKKTGLRTAGKVFGIIDIVLASLIIAGAIAMIVISIYIANTVLPQIPSGRSEYTQWKSTADTLNFYGILAAVEGGLMLPFSIVGLHLVRKSNNFILLLIFGIINIMIGGAAVLGILMICIACIECYKHKK